jgi:hypothetical protein
MRTRRACCSRTTEAEISASVDGAIGVWSDKGTLLQVG